MIWFLVILLVGVSLLVGWLLPVFFVGIPWQPTDMQRVRKMLLMSKVQPGEVVYDLGCGDGRILICAVREFGARAVGIELNPWLYFWTKLKIFFSGLSGRVKVYWGNIHNFPLHEADVVTIFLFQHVNDQLEKKFATELKPGARIVSYVWLLKNWKPLEVDVEKRLYLYRKE